MILSYLSCYDTTNTLIFPISYAYWYSNLSNLTQPNMLCHSVATIILINLPAWIPALIQQSPYYYTNHNINSDYNVPLPSTNTLAILPPWYYRYSNIPTKILTLLQELSNYYAIDTATLHQASVNTTILHLRYLIDTAIRYVIYSS
jgi:hypothetical protein